MMASSSSSSFRSQSQSHSLPPPSSSSSAAAAAAAAAIAGCHPFLNQHQHQHQHQVLYHDLDLTIVSAKHLKNVNWRNGQLKPYAVFWLDPDHKLATKPDDCGSTSPVWNERFTIPIPFPFNNIDDSSNSVFTLEIFHSKPSETPKPLVASLRGPLKDLLIPPSDHDHDHDHDDRQQRIRTLELHRPSGRPQGKIRLKVSLRDRPAPPPPPPPPDYHIAPPPPPPPPYYYSTAPPPPSSSSSSRDYHRGLGGLGFSTSHYGNPHPHPSHYPPYAPSYADPYSGYYPGYYSPPPPPRPFFDRASGYGGPGGPSAPVDFAASLYEQKPKGGTGMMGIGAGLAVGSLAGAMGGLALEEGLKYEEDKITERERVERDLASRDDYSDYRPEY